MEILSRLLPKISQLDSVGHSTVQGLTSADIAASCANCSDIGFFAIKRRYLDDWSADSGYYRIYSGIVRVGQANKWKHRGKPLTVADVRRLLDECLKDYFVDHKCPKCGGTGSLVVNEIMRIQCTQCFGKKLIDRRNYMIADSMNIKRTTYNRVWAKKHEQVMDYLRKVIPNEEINAETSICKMLKR
jgi:hypothetical protein